MYPHLIDLAGVEIHHTTRRPAGNTRARGPEQAEFDISIPEDRSAIQSAIGEVLRRIARNEIDPKRAGLLLYGLQIASLNIARQTEPARDQAPVEEITADPELGTLAPTAEIISPPQRKRVAATLIEEFRRQQLEHATSHATNPAEPAILPIIQACHRSRRESPAQSSASNTTPPFTTKRSGKMSCGAAGAKNVDRKIETFKGATDEWCQSSRWYAKGRIRPDIGRKARTVGRQWPQLCGLGNLPRQGFAG